MIWAKGHLLNNGKYEIESLLGEGGFGITYKARDVALGVFVAIKTLNSDVQNCPQYDKYVEFFHKEKKILAEIGNKLHSSIVRPKNFFEEGNLPCLVMDFINGESLLTIVQRKIAHQKKPLFEEEAIKYILQIGDALTVVHEQVKIVHRDIHPENILLKDGKAFLIDFGLAGNIEPTKISSMNYGASNFAPYEQLKQVDELEDEVAIYKGKATVDVYSLAACLYYAVTGRFPTPSIARKDYNQRLIEPKDYHPKISNRLNRAILKGMELKPQNRPQSMEEWLNLLEIDQKIYHFGLAGVIGCYIPIGFLSYLTNNFIVILYSFIWITFLCLYLTNRRKWARDLPDLVRISLFFVVCLLGVAVAIEKKNILIFNKSLGLSFCLFLDYIAGFLVKNLVMSNTSKIDTNNAFRTLFLRCCFGLSVGLGLSCLWFVIFSKFSFV